MDFGVHLPLTDLGEGVLPAADLRAYTRAAADLGYRVLAANDHLVWQRPWLDGPTVLTTMSEHAGSMALATSITLPTVRHPVVVAKWLTTLGHLTDRRIIAGLGPGSSEADHRAVGVPFEDRWARFDAAFAVVKALVRGERAPANRYYDVSEVDLAPRPPRSPEVWFGSWGSTVRLAALAGQADGWLASGYNTSPARFAAARAQLDDHLEAAGRDPFGFPDMLATTWLHVTDDRADADRWLRDVLGPTLRRDPAELARQLPVGPPEHCTELLDDYALAGVGRILLWPLTDPIGQLVTFAERVAPHVAG